MDQQAFRIPKMMDAMLVAGVAKIRDAMRPTAELVIKINPHYGAPSVDLPASEAENAPGLQYVFSENSELIPRLHLFDVPHGRNVLTFERRTSEVTDTIHVSWDQWKPELPPAERSASYVKLMSLARRHLRAVDTAGALSGTSDSEWSRYRDAQQAVLSSLAETQKKLISDFHQHRQQSDATAQARHDELERELRAKLRAEREQLDAAHAERLKGLDEREVAIATREKSFNTKEARYVARQEQQKQFDQLHKWSEGWSLTKGTESKRLAVTIAYTAALCATGGLTLWFSSQTVEILKGKDLSQVMWWQWALLTIKSILPFAAFTTFLIYFIRWSATWARQHADEEFRNRGRMLDIGRSTWLLEAVRDAQDNKQQLPPDLVKELSRNLFATSASSDADIHPQAVTDLLAQGLSSIRVKTAEGSEVEATRGKR